jgi:hypothetical protein
VLCLLFKTSICGHFYTSVSQTEQNPAERITVITEELLLQGLASRERIPERVRHNRIAPLTAGHVFGVTQLALSSGFNSASRLQSNSIAHRKHTDLHELDYATSERPGCTCMFSTGATHSLATHSARCQAQSPQFNLCGTLYT